MLPDDWDLMLISIQGLMCNARMFTFASTGMLWRELGDVPNLAIDNDPAVLGCVMP